MTCYLSGSRHSTTLAGECICRASAVNFFIPTADKCIFAGARGWLVVRAQLPICECVYGRGVLERLYIHPPRVNLGGDMHERRAGCNFDGRATQCIIDIHNGLHVGPSKRCKFLRRGAGLNDSYFQSLF